MQLLCPSVSTVADTVLMSSPLFTTIPFALTLVNNAVIEDTLDVLSSRLCFTTGIHESEPENSSPLFTIHPNPVQDQLQLSISETISKGEIIIYNLTGESVLKVDFNDSNLIVPVSNLSSGIYL